MRSARLAAAGGWAAARNAWVGGNARSAASGRAKSTFSEHLAQRDISNPFQGLPALEASIGRKIVARIGSSSVPPFSLPVHKSPRRLLRSPAASRTHSLSRRAGQTRQSRRSITRLRTSFHAISWTSAGFTLTPTPETCAPNWRQRRRALLGDQRSSSSTAEATASSVWCCALASLQATLWLRRQARTPRSATSA